MNKIIFVNDYNEMIKVEKLLIKKLKFRWSHLSSGVSCLKDKFKNDEFLKVKGGVCIFINEKIISWSYGMLTKRGAEKSETVEILSAKEVLSDPEKNLFNIIIS